MSAWIAYARRLLRSFGAMPRAIFMATVLSLPAVAWVYLDNSPYSGDASQYGTRSVDLYRSLATSPSMWLSTLFQSGQAKPPGLEWIGQFAVPFGLHTGSIDRALLYSVVLIGWFSLVLLFLVLLEASKHDMLSTAAGCLAAASSPLFIIGLTNYLVEPLQYLTTVWFLLIMVKASHWPRSLTVAQLPAAAALAMLAKASSPLFVFAPVLVTFAAVLRSRRSPEPWGWSAMSPRLAAAMALPLSLACILWYASNVDGVVAHVKASSSALHAAPWGQNDTYFATLAYWLGELQNSLAAWEAGQWLVLAIFVGGGIALLLKPHAPADHVWPLVAVALVQVAATLVVFAMSYNRTTRYLLPVLPYLALLLTLMVSRLGHPILRALVMVILAIQFVVVQAQALGLVHLERSLSAYVRVANPDDTNPQLMDALVARTCDRPNSNVVLAIDPLVKGDWLAPDPANYIVAKNRLRGGAESCRFWYAGNDFFGAPASVAWDNILATDARYVIITDPQVYPPLPKVVNQALDAENLPLLMELLRSSGRFKLNISPPQEPGILIFGRTGS